MINFNVTELDRIALWIMVISGWSFIGISLNDNDKLNLIDIILFSFANLATVICTLYLLISWIRS